MDAEEAFPRKPGNLVAELARQDLDPLSVEELQERISLLEQEISRTKAKIERAVNHRASADALFKQ